MPQGSMSDRRLAQLASLLVDQYEFLGLLGEGGSGLVYEARNRYLNRREALKVLNYSYQGKDASDRFSHEARIAATLDHPSIVKVHNFGCEEGIHWYSMQLLDGPALSDLLDARLPFDTSMFARLAVPILDALQYSHERGVIHRDIKPANILFNLEGHPFLTDFGIAKSEESVLKTRTGHMLGTPAYVSPEQALGDRVDARTDQYSLGITFYKTLAGHLPFTAENVLQTLVLRLKEDPEPLEKYRSDLDPEMVGIIMRALSRDRSQRWKTIAEMTNALLGFYRSRGIRWAGPVGSLSQFIPVRQPIPDLPLPPEQPTPQPMAVGSFEPTADLPVPLRRKRRWPLSVAAGLLLVLAGWWWWPRHETPHAAVTTIQPPLSPTPPPAAQPVPLAPIKKAAAPEPTRKPEPLPPIIRRPVVYPQLIDSPPIATSVSGCTGLRVNVSLLVAEDGTVQACKVLSTVKPECAMAAKAAAMRYRFKPALDAKGQPLETTIAAAVDFPEVP